jgi:hypothetical protein
VTLRSRIRHGMNWRWRRLVGRLSLFRAELMIQLRWKWSVRKRAHNLPGPLIVSLTSYRPRFETLEKTLKCLLTQTIKPDMTVLWIAPADMPFLPEAVKALSDRGLEIRNTEDVGSYKKIIPALSSFPDAFILIADDDVYYEGDWAQGLVASYTDFNIIPCHRGHWIILDDTGKPQPYFNWTQDVSTTNPSKYIMATGVGGVLYPPNCFLGEVTHASLFMDICPNGDDIWLYWMARLGGSTFKVTGKKRSLIPWDGSQETGLYNENWASGNDKKVAALVEEFGLPF